MRHILQAALGCCLAAWAAGAPLAGRASASPAPGRDTWNLRFAGGYEVFTHTYSLAEDDTTETVAEATVAIDLDGRSRRKSRHRWLVSANVSAGTELFRESLAGDIRWCDENRTTRLRMTFSGRALQYRQETNYGLNSDSREGRLDLRAYPLWGGASRLETRAWLSGLRFSVPSSLELDRQEKGASLVWRGGPVAGSHWSLGGRFARRTYPDSTGLDRNTLGVEGSWEGPGVRVYQRSDRRTVRDPEARPPAWYHWTDLDMELPAASGAVFLEWEDEIWRYDTASAAYPDYLRTSARLGFRWGDVLATRWRAGLGGEIMRSDDETECYDQYGVLGGWESYGLEVSGSLMVEAGWRRYLGGRDVLASTTETEVPGADVPVSGFTDFQYWKIWLTGSWSLADRLALDVMASFEPERHGEKFDNTTLGFASVRLVWRR